MIKARASHQHRPARCSRPNDQANATYPNASGGDGSDIGAFESQDAIGPTLSITTPEHYTRYADAAAVPNPATGTASDPSGVSGVTLTLYRSALYGNKAGYWDGVSTAMPTFDALYTAATHEIAAGSGDAFANWTLALPTLTPGQYYLRATATDGEGNTRSVTNVFYVNDASPTVTISNPVNKQSYPAPLIANGTAGDSNGTVQSVTLLLYRYAANTNTAGYWDGQVINEGFSAAYDPARHEHPTSTNTAGFATWTFNLSTLNGGRYYLRATARDTDGNWKTVTHTFFINDATPSVAITNPLNNKTYASTPTPATGTASDSDGIHDVSVVLYRIAGSGHSAGYWNGNTITPAYDAVYKPAHERAASSTSAGFATWSLTLPTLRGGKYWLRATARDNERNWKTVQHTFTVNDASPTVKITTPQNNKSYTTATVPTQASGTASDADGIEAVTLLLFRYAGNGNTTGYWNGVSTTTPVYDTAYNPAKHERPASTSNAFANWTLALPTLGAGKYSLRATARDTKGNTKLLVHIFTVTAASSSVAKLTESAPTASSPDSSPSATLTQSEAQASSSSITLSFSGAVPDTFDVSINGASVPVQSSTQDGQSVTLLLPEGALKVGNKSNCVSWKGGDARLTSQSLLGLFTSEHQGRPGL